MSVDLDQALDHVLDLGVVNLEVPQDLVPVHIDLDQNLKVLHRVVQGPDHVQLADLDLVAVLVLVVVHVQEVILLHVVIHNQIAVQDHALHLVPNHGHNLIANLSRYQDHQLVQNLVVVLFLIHQLVQEVGLLPIHLQGLNLVAYLPDQEVDQVQDQALLHQLKKLKIMLDYL